MFTFYNKNGKCAMIIMNKLRANFYDVLSQCTKSLSPSLDIIHIYVAKEAEFVELIIN